MRKETKMSSRINQRDRILGLSLLFFLLPSPALANTLSTDFEFSNSGTFTLGTTPETVTFSGGESKSIGVPALYRSGIRSWMVDAGNTGTIAFETPASEVALFLRDQDASVQSVLTVFDSEGQVITTFTGGTSAFLEVSLSTEIDGIAPIGSITLQNNSPSSNRYAVIDDFSFCAQQQASPELTEKLFFAQFADGGGLFSQISLFTLSGAQAVSAKIEVFNDDGTPKTVDFNEKLITGETTFGVPAGGGAVFTTDGVGDDPSGIAGAVVVSSDQPLGGVVLFAGEGLGVAGVGDSQPLESFLAPMENNEDGGIRTGVAVMNLDASEKTLTVELMDLGATIVATGTLDAAPLPGNGHVARFLDEFNWVAPPDLSNFQGLLRVTTSSGEVAATVLRVSPGELATLPVSAPR